MEDWVAVEVQTDSGQSGFFLTWGRVQDPVDPRPLEELTVRVAGRVLGDGPVRARVCASLREAADQPYFHEALLAMAQERIPYGSDYEQWRDAKAEAMAAGKEFHFLGRASE